MNNIKGFIETSFVDWPKRSCAVLFLGGCNFRCPFCHNHPLVLDPAGLVSFPIEEVLVTLQPLKKWLGGVCISGGEPTLDPELPQLLSVLHGEGFSLKLDTNGSRADVLARLVSLDLLEMISMDVKAPLSQEKYDRCSGVRVDLGEIRRSIELIKNSGVDHEFRMTVVPGYHSSEDIRAWATELGNEHSLKLQNYNPRTSMYPGLAGSSGFLPDDFDKMERLVGH